VDRARTPTRKGAKKAQPVPLTPEQAARLKAQPDTPQGRRDTLLLCLLLDHGPRVGEVTGLQVTDFDVAAGELPSTVQGWTRSRRTD
jgi:integrase